jgi:hypothetical protein
MTGGVARGMAIYVLVLSKVARSANAKLALRTSMAAVKNWFPRIVLRGNGFN